MRKLLLALALLLGAATLLLLKACDRGGDAGVVLAQPPDSKEVYCEVKPFDFVESGGKHVTLADLKGHAWAACFVFTRCSGPCPMVTATMKRLQGELKDPAIKLVSISVDPQYDTTEVLSKYADAVGADRARWWFLTGDEAAIYPWITASFWSAVQKNPEAAVGERVTHRTSICAVDKLGRVRGFYEGETAKELELLRARLEWLQKE